MSDSHNKMSQALKLDFFGLQQFLPLSSIILLLYFLQFIRLPSLGWSLLSLSISLSPSLPVFEAGAKLCAVYWASLHLQTWYCWMGLWINEECLCNAEAMQNYRNVNDLGLVLDLHWCHCSGDGAILTLELHCSTVVPVITILRK